MYLCFMIISGYKAWRLPSGTWFISDLVDVFRERYKKEHLMDMLTEVNNKVSNRSTMSGDKQMPCQVSTLRKKLYL